jgi:hypothetical protein
VRVSRRARAAADSKPQSMQLAAADCKPVRTGDRYPTEPHGSSNGPRLVNSAVLTCLLLARIEWAAIVRVIPDRAERGVTGAPLCAPQVAEAHGRPRKSRASQIGVRSIDYDKAPAVPLACAGTRCLQLARLLRFPPELCNLSKDSHRRRPFGAGERALCQYGGDCGGRIGDRDCIGPVERTEKSPGDLLDCLVGLRPRSGRGENGLIHKK